ncbi:hypothetical protein [Actinoplanes derwentensis]|uniref:Uncharacterized protein n=1 Tax=Actinoplanes derwentensis TaxID=113562 RepID=A0A1H2CEH0_9ACTN|nr:hypothetical protein [Actinoplanes derwentensis]GID86040.1 hypothetical protein Ade03nite_49640 [Actinoplanes derwentensis]SDT68833.1 hypothetical protein SAMN04489716_5682 [Actinoplanes derwentensis]
MRFFSNEAKDNVDEQENTGTAVPQQRSGSPWQHDSATAPVRPADTDDDPDRTTALPDQDRTVAFEDGSHRAEPVQVNPVPGTDKDSFATADDDKVDPELENRGTLDDPHSTQPIGIGTDAPRHAVDKDKNDLRDNDTFGTADDKPVVDSTTDEDKPVNDFDKTDNPVDFDKSDSDFAAADSSFATADTDKSDFAAADFDKDDKVVEFDKDKDKDVEDVDLSDKTADVTEPLVTPVPAAESTTISGPAPFFPSSDTQPLRERWRDVQLRFVDDPKAATNEASGLVDEAVDKLATALRDHRGSFAKGTDDTEALRVEFRSYRDILDRLLGL